MGELSCPFCGTKAESDYMMMYHIELLHSEGESAFAEDDRPVPKRAISPVAPLPAIMADQISMEWVPCPIDGCGEAVLPAELDSHLDMHAAEDGDTQSEDDETDRPSRIPLVIPRGSLTAANPPPPDALRNLQNGSSSSSSFHERQELAKASWRRIMKLPEPSVKGPSPSGDKMTKAPRRLGKAELGPYANESQMPSSVRTLLKSDGHSETVRRMDSSGRVRNVEFSPNQADGILPVIAQLIDCDSSTSFAYLCNPCVLHISKLRREGGFCGYRNIQMLASYIVATKSQGYPHFDGKIPSIFKIQELIEHAWDVGFNADGRTETGGILGTRKYIGTPEAQAMFISLDIACSAQGYRAKDGQKADQVLLNSVEQYFANGSNSNGKLRRTHLPPLYFQHPGHSMTIVGFERKRDGASNLIVFDPMFSDSEKIRKNIGQKVRTRDPTSELKLYRRGTRYLGKYKEFEVLRLTPPKDTN